MKESYRIDPEILEKIIIKNLFVDDQYGIMISSVFEKEYFDNIQLSNIFGYVKEYFNQYGKVPDRSIISAVFDEKDKIESEFKDIDSIDFDIVKNYDFLLTETNQYLKGQSIKRAIIKSVDIIESKKDISFIREEIENAICKDINIDLGLKYFQDIGKRLKEIFSASETRIPTYFPQFDEYISGGFPPFTLSVIVARIHGFKSNTLANFAARQVLNGHNVGLISLEMSEIAFSQRFDSIFSLLDINRMYLSSNRKKLMDKLKELKENEKRGELFIKQFPTGEASVNDLKRYLRELVIRKTPLDILYVDYINLMKSASNKEDGMYMKVKRVAEQLRALSFEFKIPVVSVSQLNREGSFVGFEEVDFNYIGESMGIPSTADFMAIYGVDENKMVYENELLYKIVKNRLGGQVGEINSMYYDARTLKMYDVSEEDLWMRDAEITADTREAYTRRQQSEDSGGRRRR
jgi:replicative DNA helicase